MVINGWKGDAGVGTDVVLCSMLGCSSDLSPSVMLMYYKYKYIQ